ncbi:MAG: heat-inducible transcription repressor HrcA [Anaerolineae bacterium]|nr:heat-inducible transcription repressor HrcA [Anaerolineae bacterium]
MNELSERRRAVLGMVVREFIATAQPIGSQHIVAAYELAWSPATVRNEMAALEELGYLTHPHTSAGRVPTEKGYRYFVEHLLEELTLPLAEQIRIRHQFGQARMDLEQWVRLAASILAQETQAAALATPPRVDRCHAKRIELISLREGVILLLVVLQEGRVREQMLSLEPPPSLDELIRAEHLLNVACRGADARQVEARLTVLPELAAQVGGVVADIMHRVDAGLSDHLVREGLGRVLAAPEFGHGEVARHVMRVLDERLLLESLISQGPGVGEVQVIIGGEGRWDALRQTSLILSRYGIHDGPTGMLGVLGPLRMPYGRAISTLRYVGGLMSELLADWYG